MKRPEFRVPVIALTLFIVAFSMFPWVLPRPAVAATRFIGDVERAAQLIREEKIVSVGQALSCVPRQARGKLLQIAFRETSDEANGGAVYELYVLPEDSGTGDTLIKIIVLEAASGEVLLTRRLGLARKESGSGTVERPGDPKTRFVGDVERAARLIKEGKILSVGQTLSCMPDNARGELLQVAFKEKSDEANGGAVYEVYVLSEDGQVGVVVLDARSGDPLGRRRVNAASADQ